MGYYRSLYVGPVISVDKCKIPESELRERKAGEARTLKGGIKGYFVEGYRLFDITVEKAGIDENALCLLQRHVGGQGLIRPNQKSDEFERKFNRRLSVEINADPEYLIDSQMIEAEKQWLQENFAKEIELLHEYYEVVKVEWVVVVDGS